MTRSERRRYKHLYRQLDKIYASLPRLECRGLCAESCGPIPTTLTELERIEQAVGHAVDRLSGDGCCPMLVDGRCSVYVVRPLLCRLWGMVDKMRCPHGCVPSRWPADDEIKAIFACYKAIDKQVVVLGNIEDAKRLMLAAAAIARRL